MENVTPPNHMSFATVPAQHPTTPPGTITHAHGDINRNPGAVPNYNDPSASLDAASLCRLPGTTIISPDQPVATTPSGAPLLNPRSCVTCRRRKVRCDKQMPCSNCRRAHIQCIFPAPGRAPRRPRPRDPNAPPKGSSEREMALQKRLRKLEAIIVQGLSGHVDVDVMDDINIDVDKNSSPAASPNPRHNSTSPPSSARGGSGAPKASQRAAHTYRSGSEAEAEAEADLRRHLDGKPENMHKQLGRLVLHDGGTTARYISNAFLSKLNDELDELRSEMHTLSDDPGDTEDEITPDPSPESALGSHSHSSQHQGFLFAYRSVEADLSKFHPPPSQILYMWKTYQENVEPLVKVLHVPSMDRLFQGMVEQTVDLSPGNEALVFSVYYATITSLEEEDVQAHLASSKALLLSRYRFGLEQALAKGNFLNTSDMSVLQAFTLFLIVVRRQDDTRFCWTLTALVVRMAQGLGLHRDGLKLGLPPFEVEMRRRLWWAICALDLRSTEESGTELIIQPRSFDTKLPLNIDDSDISPSTTETPKAREGRTDCAMSVVRYELSALARRLHHFSAEAGPVNVNNAAAGREERERLLMEVYDRVEENFLKHCVTGDDPLFWMAAMVARVVMAKMGLVIYQPMLFPGSGPELSADIRDRLFVSTIEVVEYNHILNTDPRFQKWRWLFKTYRQWNAIAYMLIEMSRRPWSPTCERAWKAASILVYDHPVDSAKESDHMAVWIPIKKLYLKARRHRQAEIARLRADPATTYRLDGEDGFAPSFERIDPVPGMESVAQLRTRWRKVVRPETTSPLPPQGPIPHQTPAVARPNHGGGGGGGGGSSQSSAGGMSPDAAVSSRSQSNDGTMSMLSAVPPPPPPPPPPPQPTEMGRSDNTMLTRGEFGSSSAMWQQPYVSQTTSAATRTTTTTTSHALYPSVAATAALGGQHSMNVSGVPSPAMTETVETAFSRRSQQQQLPPPVHGMGLQTHQYQQEHQAHQQHRQQLQQSQQPQLRPQPPPPPPPPLPLPTTAPGAKNDPPPWLWSDGDQMMTGGGLFDDVPIDNVDMNLDLEDINWQSWQETLRGLEKPSIASQPPPPGSWGGL
ncbi:hypothetical protein SODALDRAFT_349721 [Sodiomyces alkalinus F11]|uniref:Zn(2)-C6 fungal-type domain-containing protein n=1 Tax=Sodiomyces alkalinus (strain CBS 110278 / VKM F-3762 / F11) TaxID=1314773 RepID=A0A3N2PYL6_SODAK|nr:hypothetical protein SODALDRAFT_349721 [Sodiomyces alkalinus F11]ROT39516.1 hypothetical protein SODALDRAFT_349721 [Sodiomyces alkalinus F11]